MALLDMQALTNTQCTLKSSFECTYKKGNFF